MPFQMDPWVTQGGADPLPLEEDHCSVVEVTEEDIQNSVKFVPSLSAVVRNTECPPFIKLLRAAALRLAALNNHSLLSVNQKCDKAQPDRGAGFHHCSTIKEPNECI